MGPRESKSGSIASPTATRGDAKPVGHGISELRIDVGPGYRVYYQHRDDVLIVLLCGGDKSTQTKDIEKAHEMAKDWKDHG
ncbi:type II toxin-antitoxin system RelE/ParE family toxin [Nocardioides sp. B-3]|uniref:type II toxin-antitoxin system RelE/ParE family toxin n=1 Tax=Nocardioides sp. B-3 TaxID=2895565 RepID=UPI0021536539|nr:type II toxin-antitoxin system RelE/ParE family toxin [Nocardioides sp. B-3]UUZ58579.1 type II toxin-antitoxin system RelE/ParE family toxin [Nocardioides sp. B-3]